MITVKKRDLTTDMVHYVKLGKGASAALRSAVWRGYDHPVSSPWLCSCSVPLVRRSCGASPRSHRSFARLGPFAYALSMQLTHPCKSFLFAVTFAVLFATSSSASEVWLTNRNWVAVEVEVVVGDQSPCEANRSIGKRLLTRGQTWTVTTSRESICWRRRAQPRNADSGWTVWHHEPVYRHEEIRKVDI